MHRRNRWFDGIVMLVLIAAGCLMLLPYLWMVLSSLKSNMEIVSGSHALLPQHPSLEGYRTVLEDAPFGRWFLNSAMTSVVITAATLFTSALAGYIFAKHQFKGQKLLFILILATMMIPFQVVMIPTYLITAKLGLVNHLLAIILPNLVSSYGVFLAKQFIEDIPQDLLDAARIDGAGRAAADGPDHCASDSADAVGAWYFYVYECLEQLFMAAHYFERREQNDRAARPCLF
ncbi:carbohydrate ABC transporter permease [Paenibacillus sp. OAE614]|uniref:carbohydrate ABC transporter permease n=1 Tax=Paenibacillus sp. OAE614 TaxID=2663804 RepID=UPI003393AA0A